ncbi:unnamed protein product [Nesidiocoris tenuis]|uniref:RPEL repeat protein n=1 Tax=Nesidiocoris tenuis TaxID=355587 RepID=A0A6H5HLU7_9HEMI|nr:unnamed protein product [Nesidiocoris tenuis]
MTLKVKLMLRRPINQLVAQGIMPHVGHVDPSLAEKQRQLKKCRLVDQLNDQLSHRPGPLELIKKNILHTEPPIERAIKGELDRSDADAFASSFSSAVAVEGQEQEEEQGQSNFEASYHQIPRVQSEFWSENRLNRFRSLSIILTGDSLFCRVRRALRKMPTIRHLLKLPMISYYSSNSFSFNGNWSGSISTLKFCFRRQEGRRRHPQVRRRARAASLVIVQHRAAMRPRHRRSLSPVLLRLSGIWRI